ncbi:6-pyruvoyl trahydropterin synthase family protein [Paeniglutamicibacter antarcticus]|uniref:6-carboxy-5,6,7,8-tetrahydropterin synthase n=1 Tax=Paeniglutamicibacter antarcticus TaxID=494023 RepID=A0ABP9TR65_9MICC
MYSLTVRDHVMIAHSLPDPFFGPAQGLHGATLVIEATWRRAELGPQSVVMDIGAATAMLSEVLETLRYSNLDEHPAFAGRLSTTEAVAGYIGKELCLRFDTTKFAGLEILLREHPDAWASHAVTFG